MPDLSKSPEIGEFIDDLIDKPEPPRPPVKQWGQTNRPMTPDEKAVQGQPTQSAAIQPENAPIVEKATLPAQPDTSRIDVMKRAISAAQNAIKDLTDVNEQISGGAKVSGIVLRIDPEKYTVDAFKPESEKKKASFRVIRGPGSGQIGEIQSKIDDEGNALVLFANEAGPRKINIVRTFITPTIKTTDGSVIINPHPSKFQLDAEVTIELQADGEAQQLPAGKYRVASPVNKGSITVTDDSGTFHGLKVGEDWLVAPMNSTAGTAYVMVNGQIMPMNIPRLFEINVGDVVSISAQTFEIVATNGLCSYGETVFFEQWNTPIILEVKVGSQQSDKLVYSALPPGTDLKKGDRLSLDSTNNIALKVLPREIKNKSSVSDTGVRWADVIAQEEACGVVKEALTHPILFSELYAKYGKKPLKGVLLYGPPGTGKTLIGKAAVTEIAEAHGKKSVESAFIYVKGPELLNMYVGASEAHVRRLFNQAQMHKEEHGFPAIIFMDEAEALLGARGEFRSSAVDKTMVPMFLAEMDGLTPSSAFVMLATNRPNDLDPAITRDGRIDRKIHVRRPSQQGCQALMEHYLDRTYLAEGTPIFDLAKKATNDLWNKQRVLCVATWQDKSNDAITLSSIASGALIAGIVDRATSNAILRDAALNTASGVCEADLSKAINSLMYENLDLNHDSVIQEVGAGRNLTSVSKPTLDILWNVFPND